MKKTPPDYWYGEVKPQMRKRGIGVVLSVISAAFVALVAVTALQILRGVIECVGGC